MSQSTAVNHSADPHNPVSERVVTAVAAELNADRTAIDPIYDVVDPDALDALFAKDPVGRTRAPPRVTFMYCGCEVQISSDGDVQVAAPA